MSINNSLITILFNMKNLNRAKNSMGFNLVLLVIGISLFRPFFPSFLPISIERDWIDWVIGCIMIMVSIYNIRNIIKKDVY